MSLAKTNANKPDMAKTSDRLCRCNADRVFGGVCAGLAGKWRTDPTLIRVIAVVALVATLGLAGVVYLVLWGLIPLGVTTGDGYIDVKPVRRSIDGAPVPPASIAISSSTGEHPVVDPELIKASKKNPGAAYTASFAISEDPTFVDRRDAFSIGALVALIIGVVLLLIALLFIGIGLHRSHKQFVASGGFPAIIQQQEPDTTSPQSPLLP